MPVNETEAVMLSSPTPGLWTGRRGLAACTVEIRSKQYKVTVVSLQSDLVLSHLFCASVECVQGAIRAFGFDFQPTTE